MINEIVSEKVGPAIYRLSVGIPNSQDGIGEKVAGAIEKYVKDLYGFKIIGNVKIVNTNSSVRYNREAVLMLSTIHSKYTVNHRLNELVNSMKTTINKNLFLEREQI